MSKKTFLTAVSCMFILAGCAGPAPSPTPIIDPTNTPQPPSDPADTPILVTEAEFIVGEPGSGLYPVSGGDKDTDTVTVGDLAVEVFQTGNGSAISALDGNTVEDYYIMFRLNDDILYQGSPTTRILIEVEYLDVGTDTFMLQYDGESAEFTGGSGVVKTDTGEFLTASFYLCDAFFGNRAQDSDFRLSDNGDGAEFIRRVRVVLLEGSGPVTIEADSCGANPFDDQPDSQAIQSCLDQMCSGDTFVFTSGGGDPDYQGYLVNQTIFLVNGAKSDLTFTSSDPEDHALLQATADLLGYVVQLYSRTLFHDPGLIDDITFTHIDLDGNRAERLCVGPDGIENGADDNWGSWLPECDEPGDPWCSAGGLGMNGAFNHYDQFMEVDTNPQWWSTGIFVQDVVISNTECGTAFAFSGAAGTIDSVTIDVAGDHVHGRGCQSTDPDEEQYDWSDGITFWGPEHTITNNLIMDPSDIGIVFFGGRDTLIADNTILARPGNYGAFGGIAIHPWWFGILSGTEISGNVVTNEGDTTCGGFHAGINLGGHMWGGGCTFGSESTMGVPNDCSLAAPPPGLTFCGEGNLCRVYGYVQEGTTLTLMDNEVTGAQINYLVGGLDFGGEFVISGNVSNAPRMTDWEGDRSCTYDGVTASWGPLDFVAHDPVIEGWTDLGVYCER